ncbi:MAG: hypothetical protein ACRC33_20100, partial [Gemmataceae bacterium]
LPSFPPPSPSTAETAAPPERDGSAAPLASTWARWVGVVQSQSRPDVSAREEQAYQELRRAVLDGCAWEGRDADPDTRICLRSLAELVRPWGSLALLARMDPALREDLAQKVNAAGRSLGFQPESSAWVGWPVALFLLAAAAPFAAPWAAALFTPQEAAGRAGEAIRPLFGVFHAGPAFWVSLAGVVGVLLALWRLSKRR